MRQNAIKQKLALVITTFKIYQNRLYQR